MSPPSLSDLKQDAFISYKQDNNKQIDEHSKGWVDNFHERLEVQLVELIGRKVAIWRDPMLAGNSVLIGTLRGKIKETAALITILSPGYVRSEWCMGELREFCSVAEETGGLHRNGKSRIFAVVKIPPDGGKYPDEISQQLRYDFFAINSKTNRPDEFRHDLGTNRDQRYWNKLADLAWDLKELLTEMGAFTEPVELEKNILSDSSPATNSPSTKKKTIYLAETTDDLSEQRRQIREELKLHGYRILPERPLPYVFAAYAEEVKKNLAEADAAISLLGHTYGLIPDGAGDRSILHLQLDLANEFADGRSGFKRLIWMPEGWEASDAKLGQMLQQVKEHADPHTGMEFLQTSLEEFKTLMHKRLTATGLNGHAPKPAPAAHERRKVYLVCDRRDISDAKPLIAWLQKERRYEVVLPEFEEIEGETPLADIHQQNLLECDGVIVYYGQGSSRWVNAKKSDIEKHAGLEKTVESTRIRPLRAKAFYVTKPFDDLKDVFDPLTALVIKNFEDFNPAFLNDFISDLEGGNDNQGGNDNVQ
jgi:hypothetical protein